MKIRTKLTPRGSGGLQAVDLVTANVSSGGAFFETGSPLPAGTPVCVEMRYDLEIPDSAAFKIENDKLRMRAENTGKVIRTSSAGMAVCFDGRFRISRWEEQS